MLFGKPKQLRNRAEAHNATKFEDEEGGIMQHSNDVPDNNKKDGYKL